MPGSGPKTIAFLGATGGCGFSALRRAIEAGHNCIALCRSPAKLEAKLDEFFPERPTNLVIREGNAHHVAAVASCLLVPPPPPSPSISSSQRQSEKRLVDAVHFSVGGTVSFPSFSMDDPDVCKKAAKALLDALDTLRNDDGATGRPLLVVISTTGISTLGRDVPIPLVPFYHYALRVPHEDKRVVEKTLFACQERFVLVRPSLLNDSSRTDRPVRVHVEGPATGIERCEIGYFISRNEVGRWTFDNLLEKADEQIEYEGKAVGLTW
ncbi:hypothetical protein DCS_03607 [Drechmeria coniospora]|uniref:Uncharacterized protein n=1 Tax=Drechmeria coniospora TaxID=98403 RepID=A0A151GHP3_DRECN|nr:hypothetical protein DCS_03607 [Drechmeria coniospora]KYK56606.1 hypothetical protein DCS_03607 [Drechmeria coniospora]ODA77044.1 hypothetical protein RJ55_07562 [Drechmeria coniospora]